MSRPRFSAGLLALGAGAMSWVMISVLAQPAAVPPAAVTHDAALNAAILYPPDKAVIAAEESELIAIAKTAAGQPVIKLDGAPVALTRMEFAESWQGKGKLIAPSAAKALAKLDAKSPLLPDKSDKALWLGTVKLKPGSHVLALENGQTHLFRSTAADGSGGPSGWPLFHPHPGITDTNRPVECLSCHEVKAANPAPSLGRAKLPDTCQVCHPPVDLRLIHSHIMEPLANCLMCHDPHGTLFPSLLHDTKVKVCTQCHEAGHSRS